MSKRVNYRGEPKAKRAKPARMSAEQLRKNSGEKKGMDTSLALTPVLATTNTNGSAFTLNLVEPGNGSYNRVGRKIFNKSVRLTGLAELEIDVNASSNTYEDNLRMVVVWDKQPSGSLPVFSDIFGNTAQDGTETSSVYSAPSYDNMGRFQVLRDKIIPLRHGAGSTAASGFYMRCHFDEYIKLGNRTTVYSGQSSPCTIADISSGALYVFFRAERYEATFHVVAVVDAWARLRYTD